MAIPSICGGGWAWHHVIMPAIHGGGAPEGCRCGGLELGEMATYASVHLRMHT